MRLHQQIRARQINYKKDIIGGIVVALVSIPIAMGYAQIAGLPVIYGLYGSLLPILVFGFLTTSPQFVVGVDAMPAAMVGGLLATLGIAPESPDAMALVPMVALITALWFVVFYFIKAGKIVKYISTPVMGGFISGVGLTIILMQVPKLFGGAAGTGELIALGRNIFGQLDAFNPVAAVLGFGTVIIIQVMKKKAPRIPMTVVMLVVGALLQIIFRLDRFGVKTLPQVAGGLPKLVWPQFSVLNGRFGSVVVQAFSIAAVIMAQTLLASGSYAMKKGDKLDNNAELLAYAGMNLAGAAVGCCPINGSVSRSGIAESFGCHSQIMSVVASAAMLLVLLFCAPLLQYLPVPILTGIVMTALIGILDFKMAARLRKTSKNEFIIFLLSFFAVLLFGTVNGVLIGTALSFADVALQCVLPATDFLGRIPGTGNFHSLSRSSQAKPIQGAVIYRFNGNLFFANIDKFQQDIEDAIGEDTRVVVVDARSIDGIDVTAADRLMILKKSLEAKGVDFYLAEHHGSLNDELRLLGAGELIDTGKVRRTITLALEGAGIYKPYTLVEADQRIHRDEVIDPNIMVELEWAYGSRAENKLNQLAEELAKNIMAERASRAELPVLSDGAVNTDMGELAPVDEEELLELLELSMEHEAESDSGLAPQLDQIEKQIEVRRRKLHEQIEHLDEETRHHVELRRKHFEEYLKKEHPEEYRRYLERYKQEN